MKTNLKLQPTLKQTLHLSTSMKNHLEILNMSSEKIIDHIRQLADRNPFIIHALPPFCFKESQSFML